jgi:hypothetical protein
MKRGITQNSQHFCERRKEEIIINIPYRSFLLWTDIDLCAAVLVVKYYNAEQEALPAADFWNDNLTCSILYASKIMDNLHYQRKVENFTSVPGLGAGWFKV